MQAHILPASAGVTWVKLGARILMRQPLPMFSWALMMGVFVSLAMQLMPIGPILFIVLMPAVNVMIGHGCREILAGRIVLPFALFKVLREPGVFRQQLKLGALYAIAIVTIALLSFVPFVGDLREAAQALETGPESAGQLPAGLLLRPMLLLAALYAFVAAFFWYAPWLVAWNGLPIPKALFFSAVACWRNKWGFLVYGLCWAVILFVINFLTAFLVGLGISPAGASLLMMVPSFLVAAWLYCSFYPSYSLVIEDRPVWLPPEDTPEPPSSDSAPKE